MIVETEIKGIIRAIQRPEIMHGNFHSGLVEIPRNAGRAFLGGLMCCTASWTCDLALCDQLYRKVGERAKINENIVVHLRVRTGMIRFENANVIQH